LFPMHIADHPPAILYSKIACAALVVGWLVPEVGVPGCAWACVGTCAAAQDWINRE
jgi:Na+-driven multidrug efflux pump